MGFLSLMARLQLMGYRLVLAHLYAVGHLYAVVSPPIHGLPTCFGSPLCRGLPSYSGHGRLGNVGFLLYVARLSGSGVPLGHGSARLFRMGLSMTRGYSWLSMPDSIPAPSAAFFFRFSLAASSLIC